MPNPFKAGKKIAKGAGKVAKAAGKKLGVVKNGPKLTDLNKALKGRASTRVPADRARAAARRATRTEGIKDAKSLTRPSTMKTPGFDRKPAGITWSRWEKMNSDYHGGPRSSAVSMAEIERELASTGARRRGIGKAMRAKYERMR